MLFMPHMTGQLVRAGNPILADFILVANKLEQLGFTYYKGKVIIVEPELEKNHV
jgi:hypothetical protein